MQLLKWLIVPAVVLAVAVALTVTHCFDDHRVSVAFAVSGLTALYLWRRATFRLSGSMTNIDQDRLDSRGQRRFNTIFSCTFAISLLVMLCALVVLIAVPIARTRSGATMSFTLIFGASFVKFGVANVLTHHLMSES